MNNLEQYQNVQYKTFIYLGTYPNQWKAPEIKEMGLTHKDIKYNIPNDYKTVTPMSDQLNQTLQLNREFGNNDLICELCSHPIKNPYPIINDTKKYVMWIGSECITNFTDAKPIREQIKEFRLNKYTKIFTSWVNLAIKEINEHDKHRDKYNLINYSTYQFRTKLIKYREPKDINTLSSKKILNLFIKAYNDYKISIPKSIYEELLESNKLIIPCNNCGSGKILSTDNILFCVVCANKPFN